MSITKIEILGTGIFIKGQKSHFISLQLPKQKHGFQRLEKLYNQNMEFHSINFTLAH